MSTHKLGDRVYLEDGEEAEYVMETPAGHVVRVPLYEDPDDTEPSWSNVRIVETVFAAPLVSRIAAEIEERRERLRALKEEYATLYKDASWIEATLQERRKELEKWDGFRLLEAFLAKKITHMVLDEYRGPRILTLDEALKADDESGYRPKKLKLLSLFGQSNGDLLWGVNRWSDGSGGHYTQAYPVTSYEEGVEKAASLWQERIDAWRKTGKEVWRVADWIKAVQKIGLEVPEDVANASRAHRVAEAERRLEEVRKNFESAQAAVEQAKETT